jgi:hypothetical protein
MTLEQDKTTVQASGQATGSPTAPKTHIDRNAPLGSARNPIPPQQSQEPLWAARYRERGVLR